MMKKTLIGIIAAGGLLAGCGYDSSPVYRYHSHVVVHHPIVHHHVVTHHVVHHTVVHHVVTHRTVSLRKH